MFINQSAHNDDIATVEGDGRADLFNSDDRQRNTFTATGGYRLQAVFINITVDRIDQQGNPAVFLDERNHAENQPVKYGRHLDIGRSIGVHTGTDRCGLNAFFVGNRSSNADDARFSMLGTNGRVRHDFQVAELLERIDGAGN